MRCQKMGPYPQFRTLCHLLRSLFEKAKLFGVEKEDYSIQFYIMSPKYHLIQEYPGNIRKKVMGADSTFLKMH